MHMLVNFLKSHIQDYSACLMFDVNQMYLLKYKKNNLRVLYRMTLVINKHTISFDKGYPNLFSVFLVVFTNEH